MLERLAADLRRADFDDWDGDARIVAVLGVLLHGDDAETSREEQDYLQRLERASRPRPYDLHCPCAGSPTGWVELREDMTGSDWDWDRICELTAAEILTHPKIRVLSADRVDDVARVYYAED